MSDPTAAYASFLGELTRAGLLIPSGVPGVFGRAGAFEDVVQRFEQRVTALGREPTPTAADEPGIEVMHFPPVFPRAHYTRTSHIHNFPDLMGSIHAFTGKDREHAELTRKLAAHEDWTRDLTASDLMLVPAACYPLYPAATGELAEKGRTVDLVTWVFRHEPSPDPARMMIFRQREYVRLGSADQALTHRDGWLERGRALLEALELPVRTVIATDPFFGRGGRLSKATQREQVLKWELVVPICSEEQPTAVASCNYHLDYFGQTFAIHLPDGRPAHTACVGFGLERIGLALFKTHGLDVGAWPRSTRETLGLA